MSREDIARQRREIQRHRRRRILPEGSDTILVAALLAGLQVSHRLRAGWFGTGLMLAGFIIAGIILNLIRNNNGNEK